jgi:hypothetical protein
LQTRRGYKTIGNPKSRSVFKSRLRLLPLALLPLLPAVGASAGGAGHQWDDQGSWIEGWGGGTVTAESPNPCVSTQPCVLTVSGSGASQGAVWLRGRFDVQGNVTVDLRGAVGNGFDQACYPVTGTLTLSPMGVGDDWNVGSLAVDIQGQGCAVGSNPNPLAAAATYVVDGANSTGIFAGASGTGTMNASLDLGQSPPAVGFAFSGSLQTTGSFRKSAR